MESIEHEMGDAFEVRNREALHHYALLLAENMVTRAEYTAETGTLHEDIREILTEMRLRFDAGDKRFEQMFRFQTLTVTVLALLITEFKFLLKTFLP